MTTFSTIHEVHQYIAEAIEAGDAAHAWEYDLEAIADEVATWHTDEQGFTITDDSEEFWAAVQAHEAEEVTVVIEPTDLTEMDLGLVVDDQGDLVDHPGLSIHDLDLSIADRLWRAEEDRINLPGLRELLGRPVRLERVPAQDQGTAFTLDADLVRGSDLDFEWAGEVWTPEIGAAVAMAVHTAEAGL